MTHSRSILSLILAITIAHQILPLYAGNAVPVILWGSTTYSNSAVSPFLRTSKVEFKEILMNAVGSSMPPIIAFSKENFCVEDIRKHRELQQIMSDGTLVYIPAVEAPLSVLENFMSYNLTSDDNTDSISNGQLLIIPITNLEAVNDIYKTVKESNPNSIAVLTGRSCSFRRFERIKREVTQETNNDFIISLGKVLLYSSKPPLLKKSASSEFVPIPSEVMNTTSGTGTMKDPLVLRLEYEEGGDKIVLKFLFEVETFGYYTLKTVMFGDTPLKTNTEIVFPHNFSYHCSQNIIFYNDSVYLNITNLQVQVDATSFGDAYDCVGFTTIPIWTGIFVTAILALIMIWGLTMIIDIRTMDRFDDPKGKTITISAQE